MLCELGKQENQQYRKKCLLKKPTNQQTCNIINKVVDYGLKAAKIAEKRKQVLVILISSFCCFQQSWRKLTPI